MGQYLEFEENGINIIFEVTDEKRLCLLHLSNSKFNYEIIGESEQWSYVPVEIQTTGNIRKNHRGGNHIGANTFYSLQYQKHMDYFNELGRKLEFALKNEEISVVLHYQFYNGVSVIKSWVDVANICDYNVGIEYISSFALHGIDKEGQSNAGNKMQIMIPHNSWCREISWRKYSLTDLGYDRVNRASTKRISISNTGTWSTKEYLPMGCVINTEAESTLMWQIESNGSWQWEISDIDNKLYLKISGPNENENYWWKNLKPNEAFQTVPVAVSFVNGGFDEALAEMTKYRRKIVRKNQADSFLPVIFNDYMNCLRAEPTTEKLIPVINAAAQAGAEYFCIDAGWYADGTWWDTVGEWQPCAWRFPNGIKEVLDYIKSKNMIPGMWLEIEVIGIYSPNSDKFDDDCYFMRHGKKAIDRGRYQLDFRNKKVIDFATSVVDRLVSEYGVGYIKMDYNIDAGIGTEVEADSFGDGLLQHNRAYLNWIKSIMDKYPSLIIENCSSGGMRIDYAMLSLHSIQSVTDQENYINIAPIAASSATAVLPEQAAIWSYPLANADDNEVVFNMVNAMLCRIHLSGQIMQLPAKQFSLVKEGIEIYKELRKEIKEFIPFYPLELPKFNDNWICVGYKADKKAYLAVWRIDGKEEKEITLSFSVNSAKCIYPNNSGCEINLKSNSIIVKIPQKKSAVIIAVE